MSMTIPRVLYVEDNSSERAIFHDMCRLLGWHGQSADNGFQALELIRKVKWDLIISDVQMPEMDGMELVLHIRMTEHRNADTPIMFVTCDPDFKLFDFASTQGVWRVLAKPLFMSTLRLTMEDLRASLDAERKAS